MTRHPCLSVRYPFCGTRIVAPAPEDAKRARISFIARLMVFPQSTVQTPDQVQGKLCIVHLRRHSLNCASRPFESSPQGLQTRHGIPEGDHQAADATAAQAALIAFEEGEWGRKCAAIGQSWRQSRRP